MLISGFDMIGTPVLSLQTGMELARTETPIINPHNLAVIAYEVAGPTLDVQPSLLRAEDVREFSSIGLIVDSSDEFVQPEDIIKLNDIYMMHFTLTNKQVLDEKRNKLGKVTDYNIDSSSFMIQQLTVKRPLLKSFNDSELIIHRSQVIEITDQAIVIKSKANANKPLPKDSRSYANPFRQGTPQTESFNSSRKS
jgi:uncharacterized protein YrrD